MGTVDGAGGTYTDQGSPGLRPDSSVDSLDTQLGPNAPRTAAVGKKKQNQPVNIPPISSSLIRDRYWRGFRSVRPETY